MFISSETVRRRCTWLKVSCPLPIELIHTHLNTTRQVDRGKHKHTILSGMDIESPLLWQHLVPELAIRIESDEIATTDLDYSANYDITDLANIATKE
jgi:hypothetical protein